jgi:hypothetical protein
MFWIGFLVGSLFLLFLEAGGIAYIFHMLDKSDKQYDETECDNCDRCNREDCDK